MILKIVSLFGRFIVFTPFWLSYVDCRTSDEIVIHRVCDFYVDHLALGDTELGTVCRKPYFAVDIRRFRIASAVVRLGYGVVALAEYAVSLAETRLVVFFAHGKSGLHHDVISVLLNLLVDLTVEAVSGSVLLA